MLDFYDKPSLSHNGGLEKYSNTLLPILMSLLFPPNVFLHQGEPPVSGTCPRLSAQGRDVRLGLTYHLKGPFVALRRTPTSTRDSSPAPTPHRTSTRQKASRDSRRTLRAGSWGDGSTDPSRGVKTDTQGKSCKKRDHTRVYKFICGHG